jgi:serine/threonine protein phosphatase PrpC
LKENRDKGWRAKQKKYKEKKVITYNKNREPWSLEKNWKLLYMRSEKLKRAKQLGIEYPIQPLELKVNEQSFDITHQYSIDTYLEQSSQNGADNLSIFYGEERVLICLADGAGGTSGAKEASTMIMQWFEENQKLLENSITIESLEEQVNLLDKMMYKTKSVGESTFVMVLITDTQIMGVSVGDSKCWMFGKDFDHELSLMQYRKPLLGSGEAQAIGFCMEMMGSIVIGSDGLFDYTSIEKIKYEIQDKNTTAKNLAMLAKEATGGLQDDISVVLVKEKHGHTSS